MVEHEWNERLFSKYPTNSSENTWTILTISVIISIFFFWKDAYSMKMVHSSVTRHGIDN